VVPLKHHGVLRSSLCSQFPLHGLPAHGFRSTNVDTMKLNAVREVAASHRDTRSTAPAGSTGPAVTGRAFVLGLLLAAGMAGLNCWIATVADVHFLGGVQMPFGAVFVLLFFILAVNLPLRALHRVAPWTQRLAPPLTPVELLTIYSMLLFAAMLSTPGCDNFFLTTGPTLFYFSTPENGWAALFYQHVPTHFAPGWDGHTYQREVIDRLYLGGLTPQQIPWHAWSMMLIAWSVFLLLIYATLFFFALLLRRQWIENEALTFPLVQLPLQMVEVDAAGGAPPARVFWNNHAMWAGFALAAAFHFLRGMNNFYPDWPALAGFQGKAVWFVFTERPWNSISELFAAVYLGAIGLSYLLTREVSFSFWFFFLLGNCELVMAGALGFPVKSLPKDTYLGRPEFITFQSIGGWVMMAVLLLWTARHHLKEMCQAALNPQSQIRDPQSHEPFSARFVVLGFVLCCAGLLGWCWFAGINLLAALVFFGIYLLASLVLARLVIEGGFLFPQLTFSPLEWMTSTLISAPSIGAASLTRLSFFQPMLMADMRTNVLPGFLHTLKIAHDLKLDRRGTRRLMASVACAIIVTLLVTIVVSLWTLYAAGGLSSYSWFTYKGPRQMLDGTAKILKAPPPLELLNAWWIGLGAAVVWLLTLARSRWLWFSLHPLGFIVSSSYPITQLWFSFFVGWLIKSLLMKYGGSDAAVRVRPFMIGLILGNLCAMMAWMLFGFWKGGQISYWPA